MNGIQTITLLTTIVAVLAENEGDRIQRDLLENIKRDDPAAKCRNGGIFAGGECHCIHPHTGPTCQDYACVHGMSVGRRYDPNSLFFNKPCICNEGWSGDLCEYHLTDKCSSRGEWKNNRCECIGHFFGSVCQYTSKCEMGTIRHGRCICHKDWEGDYCDQIVCHHGYPDTNNNSMSCTCPAQYRGIHCDECSQIGPKIAPYPKCIVELVPAHARATRKKTKTQIRHRLIIIIAACSFLGCIALVMLYCSIKRNRNKDSAEERARMLELSERTAMLQEQAMRSGMEPAPPPEPVPKKDRRRSLTNPFRFTRKLSSKSEARRALSTVIPPTHRVEMDLPESNHLSLVKKERRKSLTNPFRTKRSNSTTE